MKNLIGLCIIVFFGQSALAGYLNEDRYEWRLAAENPSDTNFQYAKIKSQFKKEDSFKAIFSKSFLRTSACKIGVVTDGWKFPVNSRQFINLVPEMVLPGEGSILLKYWDFQNEDFDKDDDLVIRINFSNPTANLDPERQAIFYEIRTSYTDCGVGCSRSSVRDTSHGYHYPQASPLDIFSELQTSDDIYRRVRLYCAQDTLDYIMVR